MVSRLLVPVAAPLDPRALDLLPLLTAALSGEGPALLLHPPDVPPAPSLAPGEPLADAEDDPHDPTVALTSTSGSTGPPKGALLPASALLASASATHDRLGGPARWVLALSPAHVAGLQVLVRSLVSRTEPVVVDASAGFTPQAFVAAARACTAPRRYTALVPTQLVRLLDAGPGATEALASFDAVLIGGGALDDGLRTRARQAGIPVVATYGMSETCGGCVYDGVPLDGVTGRIDGEGRVHLGGPVVARGYRGVPAGTGPFTVDHAGTRWLATPDAGRWDGARLTIVGRLDDVLVTGGLKVSPAVVEAALAQLPAVQQVVVVGVPDAQWGQRVVAAVVVTPGHRAPTLTQVRDHVGAVVAAHAAPRQLLVLDRLPTRGPGKPDRAAIERLAAR